MLIFEWWHNSIKVTFNRVTAYSVFMTVYFVILCLVSIFKPDSKPYFAIDFVNSRSTSSNVIILMSVAFAGSLKLWSVVSVMKFGPAKEVSDDVTKLRALKQAAHGGSTTVST
ncbi:MAG: hypothetical protein ACKO96_36020 [Flammeovirgaceae bacterium]